MSERALVGGVKNENVALKSPLLALLVHFEYRDRIKLSYAKLEGRMPRLKAKHYINHGARVLEVA